MERRQTCYCGRPLEYCQVTDRNGNRHVWTWCPPCDKTYQTVPRALRPTTLDIDALPVHLTQYQRGQPRAVRRADEQDATPTPARIAYLLRIAEEYRRLLKSLPYRVYLKSEHWDQKRKAAVTRAGGLCQLCNRPGQLNAHHRTYARIGEERPDDIIVLCRSCHAKFHDKLP